MENALRSLLAILLLLTGSFCFAQSAVHVSDPRLQVRDNKLLISYDILNGEPEEKYIISIDVRDADGNLIRANTLEGDVGMVEDAGTNKQIIWDPAADNVFINSSLYIKVNLEIVLPPRPAADAPSEIPSTEEGESGPETTEESPRAAVTEKEQPPVIETVPQGFSRTGLILQSLALPGLGLSRYTGQPHWIRGVAGYGCMAGSIALNSMAFNNYEGISDLNGLEQKEDQYDQALQQYRLSRTLAYAAIGIWVIDFIWTISGTRDLKGPGLGGKDLGITIGTDVDPVTLTPLLSLHYIF